MVPWSTQKAATSTQNPTISAAVQNPEAETKETPEDNKAIEEAVPQQEETELIELLTEDMDKCCLILREGEEFANLYYEPDTESRVICEIPANEYVYLVKYNKYWSNVYYQGQLGYVENEKLAMYNPKPKTVIAEETPAEDIINEETLSEEDILVEINVPDSEIAEEIDESYEADSEVMTEEETQITTGNEESIVTEITEEQTTVGNEETENSETAEKTEESGEETENTRNLELRKVYLTTNVEGRDFYYIGQKINLYANLEGFENEEYTIQWQCSTDRINFEDIPGASGDSYSFIMDENTFNYLWSFRVILNSCE